MADGSNIFLVKAREALAGAESEYANERFNNSANRCYYACFQAAVHALTRAGIVPRGRLWSHEFVQGQFVGQLINRRKVYPAELREILPATQVLRETADYGDNWVTRREAPRALRHTRMFLEAVQAQ